MDKERKKKKRKSGDGGAKYVPCMDSSFDGVIDKLIVRRVTDFWNI